MKIEESYIYANAQPLAQHNGKYDQPIYFYLHDRLGSVRLMIDTTATVEKSYTYNPFGEILESEETDSDMKNPFLFAGQWLDTEISQYYLRARMYDPYISRFTSRDPVTGKFESPLTLHKYLYCGNDPVNWIDPTGLQGDSEGRSTVLNFALMIGVAIDWELMTAVEGLANISDLVAGYASRTNDKTGFVETLLWLLTDRRGPNLWEQRGDNAYTHFEQLEYGQSGFKSIYQDERPGSDQVRHFVGSLAAGYYYGVTGGRAMVLGNEFGRRGSFRWRHPLRGLPDIRLGFKGVELGALIMGYPSPCGLIANYINLNDVGNWIRKGLGE